jgi:hypothetical protein
MIGNAGIPQRIINRRAGDLFDSERTVERRVRRNVRPHRRTGPSYEDERQSRRNERRNASDRHGPRQAKSPQ